MAIDGFPPGGQPTLRFVTAYRHCQTFQPTRSCSNLREGQTFSAATRDESLIERVASIARFKVAGLCTYLVSKVATFSISIACLGASLGTIHRYWAFRNNATAVIMSHVETGTNGGSRNLADVLVFNRIGRLHEAPVTLQRKELALLNMEAETLTMGRVSRGLWNAFFESWQIVSMIACVSFHARTRSGSRYYSLGMPSLNSVVLQETLLLVNG